MRRLLLVAALAMVGCAAPLSGSAGHRVGTDIHFPPVPGGGSGLVPVAPSTIIANTTGGTATPTANNVAAILTMLGVQASTSVAITGGTITGVNNATSTTQGMMAPSDKLTFDSFNAWARTQRVLINAVLPTATSCFSIPVGGALPTNAVDGQLPGGWSGGAGLAVHMGSSVTILPKSGRWAYVVRAKIKGPTSGRVSDIGLANNANTNGIIFGTIFSVDATHFILSMFGGVGATQAGPVADASLHDHLIWSDAAVVHWYIDGVDTTKTITVTDFSSDEPYLPFLLNTTSLDATVQYEMSCV